MTFRLKKNFLQIRRNAPIVFTQNYAANIMLSLKDFREKQILLIQNELGVENKIRFENDNVVFEKDGKVANRLSCFKILAIFIIGDTSITSVLMRNCLKYGIALFMLKNNFELYASIGCGAEGNYLLRKKQYQNLDEFDLSKRVVANKILNQFRLLKLAKMINKQKFENSGAEATKKVKAAKDNQKLLGIEGNYTKNFFQTYFNELNWRRRMPRTKYDPYNVLMDMGYTFLFNYIETLLKLYGFDVYKGFYHKLFFQRKSLVCDLMEPFRCIIDKQLLKSFRLRQIDNKDFKIISKRYALSYDKSQKYALIFLEALVSNKEKMFSYIKDFYKCVIKDEKDYRVFKIS